uniref:U1-type domain-containing protein n=1 Tax=Vitis vinifera TaxID=29760 RepID=F6GYD2_VITVI
MRQGATKERGSQLKRSSLQGEGPTYSTQNKDGEREKRDGVVSVICSANKLSCIDCGETFGQQSVQGHTQCITEAEKYGPKGQGKALNGTPAKAKSDSKQRPEVDITVGLSERPPWFCSLCNTKATSKQALLLHVDGKKHQAKARAFHAANEPKQKEESTKNGNVSTENISKDESIGNKNVEAKMQNPPQMATVHGSLETENENLASKKKRKLDASDNNGDRKKVGGDASGELGNGEVIQVETAEARELQLTSPAHVSTFRGAD